MILTWFLSEGDLFLGADFNFTVQLCQQYTLNVTQYTCRDNKDLQQSEMVELEALAG